MLTRRNFLATGTVALAAGAVAPRLVTAATNEWDAVRDAFDLDPSLVHLSLFFLTPHPRPVRTAIEDYRRQLDANPFLTVEHANFDFEHPERTLPAKVAATIAGYIGAKSDDIALTQNTTTGLSLVYHGLPLKKGDEIVTTVHDHYSHHESIRLAAERSGATWRKIALFDTHDSIDGDQIVERITKAIGPKTRVVGITWVHSSTGLKLPIRRIASALEGKNVILVVDGVHGIGVEDPRDAVAADVFIAGTHKWIFAPRGTGFVWAKPEVWATMRPLIPSFSNPATFIGWMEEKPPAPPARASWFTPGGFQAFEHWWAVPAAFEFHRRIGSARITERIHSLNERVKNELASMKHVTLYTPRKRELSAGIVCFDVKGKTAMEVVQTLHTRDHILASTSPYRVSYARVAFGIQNNEGELEKTVRAIATL